MLFGIQYIIKLSMSSSIDNLSNKPPSGLTMLDLLVAVENFSRMYAANAAGESLGPTPENFMTLIHTFSRRWKAFDFANCETM